MSRLDILLWNRGNQYFQPIILNLLEIEKCATIYQSITLLFSYVFRMKIIIQLWTAIILFQCIFTSFAADPKFDPTTRMRLVLVPADAAVGSVIYRLRATDEEFDYPLTFELVGMF